MISLNAAHPLKIYQNTTFYGAMLTGSIFSTISVVRKIHQATLKNPLNNND
jgi:hypothetical protein